MKALPWIVAIAVAVSLAVGCPAGFAQEPAKPWTGKLADGTVIDADDLKRILVEHGKWLNKEDGGTQANLERAWLAEAKLEEARLERANLEKAELFYANLEGVWLRRANLKGAVLIKANLKRGLMVGINLQRAELNGANMQGVVLSVANLEGARLDWANLEGADLFGASMQGAVLGGANLRGARLYNANLQGAIFEIEPNTLPEIPSMAAARNLALLQYSDSPHALVELREAFKKYGLRRQEREITYAIKHSGFLNEMEHGDLLTKIEVVLGWIFFEQTCQWGMSSERPLFILLGLMILFTLLYTQAIQQDLSGKKKIDGIWKVWIPGRVRNDLGKKKPKEILESMDPGFCFKMGFYFSVLSAFNIGWREINIGNWISRMQSQEYRFQASGWARSVSGLQSLISVYLLALCVLSYFGRPFEGY